MEEKPLVFIVEDDPLMIRMYERIFRLSGFGAVELAGNGEEALDKLNKTEILPSIILLDIMMPKMNGFEVLTNLKANEKLKNIPVIVLSNLAGQEDAKKAVEMGAALYLVKSDHTPKQVVDKTLEILGKAAV
jgi:CheY-like chemotaxis protein